MQTELEGRTQKPTASGLTRREIRKRAVAKHFGARAVRGASDEVVDRLFTVLVEENRADRLTDNWLRQVPPELAGDRAYVPASQVLKRFQITEMTLWRWLRHEKFDFPKPVWIGNRRYFREDELIAFESSRKAVCEPGREGPRERSRDGDASSEGA